MEILNTVKRCISWYFGVLAIGQSKIVPNIPKTLPTVHISFSSLALF